jgi:phosphoglycolate phosphatase-like HAD superfamily hydrolase
MKKMMLSWLFFLWSFAVFAQTDPLPSWQDRQVKKDLINFVHEVTDKNNKSYVVPSDRIATIDNDGTLWLEQPMYTEIIFAMQNIKSLSAQHPEWKSQLPFKAIINNDHAQQEKFTKQDIEKIIAVTHSGMTVEDFNRAVKDWLATAKNPKFKRHYTELVYKPMLEVVNYLLANNFKVYIVSGGGQDFIRVFSQRVYDIPVEQVIGTAGKTKYTYSNGQVKLTKLPNLLLIDDSAGKPEAIHLFIGKKPIIAFGNSDGDRQMLEWTQANKNKHLMLLVHHDDAQREYAYGPQSKVGRFSDSLMQEALKNHWDVISMKNDWKVVFPFEKK